MRPFSMLLGQSRLRHLCLRLLFQLVLLLGGLGALRAEVSELDSLSVERVERLGTFDAEQLERSFGLVRFRSSAQARYALDLGDESWYLGSVKMDAFYKEFATEYTAPWKLIPLGERDVVEAYYEGSKGIDLSRVRFASTPDSPALPADYDESRRAWTLTLPAAESNSSYEVFALYEGKVIGKLRVVSYPKQSYKLRLVPVNGQSVGDVSRLSQQLNSIYNKYGVSFTLSEAEGGSTELKAKSLSQDLRKLQDDYEAQHSLSGDEVCLFILRAELSKGSKYEELEGLMPRGKRFGYIFAGNSPNEEALARILAHELGHGLFTLQHTFDNEYGGERSKGKTSNLMDYTERSEAVQLAAFQWNVIANKAPFTALDREKESQLRTGASCMVIIGADISNKILRSGKAVLSPSGDKIQLPNNTVITALFYEDSSEHPAPQGSIASFSIDSLHYATFYSIKTSKFAHYSTKGEDIFSPAVSSLPTVSIQIDKANHRITIEGEVFQLDRSDFSCEASESRTFSRQHFKIAQAAQEKLAFGTRDWDKAQTPLEGQEELVDKFVQLVKDFDGGGAYLGEVIADKLSVYQKRNGSKFVVVTGDIDLISLNQASWNAFAQEVFKRSGLGNRDILITIPRASARALLTDGIELNMPGLAYGAGVSIDTSKLSTEYDPTQKLARALAGGKPSGVIAFVMDVFMHTKKKVVIHRGYFTPSRSITIITDTHRGAEVSGYPYNEAIIPYVQKGTDKLVSIVQERASQYSLRGRVVAEEKVMPQGLEVQTIEEAFARQYIPVFEQLAREGQDLNNYEAYTVAVPIHYREGCISEKNQNGDENHKAYLLQYAYEDLLSELGATTKGGFSFQQEHAFTDKTDWYLSRYVDKPVYATLDGASVVLGFIGWDTAPDALNLFYSVARGHTLQASLAGASLLMVGPTALTALKYADEVAQGVEITARIAKATPQPHGPRYVYYAPKTKQVYSDVVYKQPIQVGKEAKNIAEHELLRGIDPQQILEAQEVLTKAGHTKLAMQADALRIVIELRAHRNFKAFGLSDELLGEISSTVNTEGYAQIVTNLRTFIDKFDHNKVEGLKELVKLLGHPEPPFREGAEWTLRYLANHADELNEASRISFEISETLPNGKERIADMVVEYPDLAPIYYEFKSVKNLPPHDFVEQFSKDLSRPNFSIDNLRWVFDGKKITRQNLDKLIPDIQKILSKWAPKMPQKERDLFTERILEEVFIVN